jgi:hypothetical protein
MFMKIKFDSAHSEREWDRLLSASQNSGLSRPELWRAVVRGDVVGSHIRKPGKSKGTWLVNLKSLDDYIRSFLPGGSRFSGQVTQSTQVDAQKAK